MAEGDEKAKVGAKVVLVGPPLPYQHCSLYQMRDSRSAPPMLDIDSHVIILPFKVYLHLIPPIDNHHLRGIYVHVHFVTITVSGSRKAQIHTQGMPRAIPWSLEGAVRERLQDVRVHQLRELRSLEQQSMLG